MKTVNVPYIQNNKAWYFLSIFYARDKWPELITQIVQFYENRKGQFDTTLISLSEERGEHVQVSFASSNVESNFQDEIIDFFRSYIDYYPSQSTKKFPYGKALWCNYANNTLVWNRYTILNYSDAYIYFHQKTFNLALLLLENDLSSDNVFNAGLYFFAKGLSHIEPVAQMKILFDTLQMEYNHFRNYSFVYSIQKIIDNDIDLQEIYTAIDSYWDENISEYSFLLTEWLNEADNIIKYGYKSFCSLVCRILGLNGLHEVLILKLLNIWYLTKHNVNI
jgi:hypothetical protein